MPSTARRCAIALGLVLLCRPAHATTEEKYLDATGVAGDALGTSVDLSASDAVAGAPDNDDQGADAGKAVVVDLSGAGVTSLYPSIPKVGSRFGAAVAISADTIVVGAPDAGNGLAFVFVRSGGTWTQQALLLQGDGHPGDRFGTSVDVDGNYAIVGASLHDSEGTSAGAAYVFLRTGTTWSLQQKLVAFDAQPSDYFGSSVSVSGVRAVVSATNAGFGNPGSVYPFRRSLTTWTNTRRIKGVDSTAVDQFGTQVAASGTRFIAGANLHEHPPSAGAAYLWQDEVGFWSQRKEFIEVSIGNIPDNLGRSVGLAGDLAAVSAPWGDGIAHDSGLVYVYKKGDVHWSGVSVLTASDGFNGQKFGWAVAAHGNCVLVGAPNDDDSGAGSGALYRYCSLPYPLFEFEIDVICCFIPPIYTSGPIEFEITFWNLDVEDQAVDRRVDLIQPDGTSVPLFTLSTHVVPAGASLVEPLDFEIPGRLQQGGYGIIVYTSDETGDHSQMLTFTTSPPIPGVPGFGLLPLAAILCASGAWFAGRRRPSE